MSDLGGGDGCALLVLAGGQWAARARRMHQAGSRRPRPRAPPSQPGGQPCWNFVPPANTATRPFRRVRSKHESAPSSAPSAPRASPRCLTTSARTAQAASSRDRFGPPRTGRVTTTWQSTLPARPCDTGRLSRPLTRHSQQPSRGLPPSTDEERRDRFMAGGSACRATLRQPPTGSERVRHHWA